MFSPRDPSVFFFTLLFQSRTNTSPRVISPADSRAQSLFRIPLKSSFESLGFLDRRDERVVLEDFRRSPPCNVRAKRHPCLNRSLVTFLSNNRRLPFSKVSSLFPLHSRLDLDKQTQLDLDQHVQTIFPDQGSCGQGGQAEQEVVSRAYQGEAAAISGQSAGWEVSTSRMLGSITRTDEG